MKVPYVSLIILVEKKSIMPDSLTIIDNGKEPKYHSMYSSMPLVERHLLFKAVLEWFSKRRVNQLINRIRFELGFFCWFHGLFSPHSLI
jgi:hypothetical protein